MFYAKPTLSDSRLDCLCFAGTRIAMKNPLRTLETHEASYLLAQRIAEPVQSPAPVATEEEWLAAVWMTPTGSDPAKRLDLVRNERLL